ncbi:MAG: C4-dicarboxylate ABC transporter [Bacteroidia bacterium]|nr:C4-dicarboxylate ABC transporter [Bacteroidia bacterium]
MMSLEEIREKRAYKIGNIVKYFGAIMGLFYLVLGTSILLNKVPLSVNEIVKYTLGVAMVLYGVFRLFRILKSNEQ